MLQQMPNAELAQVYPVVPPQVPSGEMLRPVAVAAAEVVVALAVERVAVGPVDAVAVAVLVSVSRMMLVLKATVGRAESGLTAQTRSYSSIHSSFS